MQTPDEMPKGLFWGLERGLHRVNDYNSFPGIEDVDSNCLIV